jgi:hypothetical protein
MRRRYKFVGRDEHGNYVWESVLRIPGDSRVEQIKCSPAWFWAGCERPGNGVMVAR